jgi:hypothetical protein
MPKRTDQNGPGDDAHDPVASPYGPHPNGVDEAAGGADSSPFENEATGTRQDVAAVERYMNRTPENDPAGDPARRSPIDTRTT